MVIHNFNVLRTVRSPNETDPELTIDSDAVLPLSVTVPGFQPVSRWRAQVGKINGRIEHAELSFNHRHDGRPAPGSTGFKKGFGIRAFEASDHRLMLNVIR